MIILSLLTPTGSKSNGARVDLSISAILVSLCVIISSQNWQTEASPRAEPAKVREPTNRLPVSQHSVPISVLLNDRLGGPEVTPSSGGRVSFSGQLDNFSADIIKVHQEFPLNPSGGEATRTGGARSRANEAGNEAGNYPDDGDVEDGEIEEASLVGSRKEESGPPGKLVGHLDAQDKPRIIKGILAGFIGRRKRR